MTCEGEMAIEMMRSSFLQLWHLEPVELGGCAFSVKVCGKD